MWVHAWRAGREIVGAGAFPNARRDRRREQEYPMTQSDWTRRKFLRSGYCSACSAPALAGALLGACSSPTPPSAAPTTPPSSAGAGAASTQPAAAQQAPAQAPTQPAAAATSGGTLVAGWEEDAANLDPTKLLCAHESRIAELYSDTLWEQFGDSTEPKPGLAATWQPSPDGLTWDVTLRPGVKFQDGTPVDADAIKWNFDRWLDPQHPFYDGPYGLLSYYLGAIQGVEKTGDNSAPHFAQQARRHLRATCWCPTRAPVSPTAVQKMGKQQIRHHPGVRPAPSR